MKKAAILGVSVLLFLVFSTTIAMARTHEIKILIDTDDDEMTGCAVATSDGTVSGVEKILITTVETQASTATVTDVSLQGCNTGTGSFEPPMVMSSGGWPVGIGQGVDGADVVETFVDLDRLQPTPFLRLALLASEAGNVGTQDTLLFKNGNSGNRILVKRFSPPIPVLAPGGVFLLMLILAALGMVYARKKGKNIPGTLVVIVIITATVGFAWAICSPDGDVSDWTGITPVAGDSGSDNPGSPDIVSFFARESGRQYCFRVDIHLPLNSPPVLDLDGPADDPGGDIDFETNFVAGSGPVAVVDAANLTITDDQANLASATVSLSGRMDGTSEILAATGAGSIGVMYDPSTGILTLTGPDTVAAFQTVLRTVTYDNTQTHLTAGDREILFVVNDGFTDSTTAKTILHVMSINHAPSFTPGMDQTVDEDSGAQTVSGWATDIDDGEPNLSQSLTFQVTSNTNPGLFSSGPSVDPVSGDLTFTPAADAFGLADITIVLKDNGGTANGGVDTSSASTFKITVDNVNDPPDAVDDSAEVDEDSTNNSIDALSNDDFAPDTGETLTIISVGTISDGGTVMITGGGTGLLYSPAPDFFGTETFTYTIGDGNGGNDTATVSVTVNNLNDPPSAVDDTQTVEEDSTDNAMDVLSNDEIAPDTGETLTITAVGTPSAGGSVSIIMSGLQVQYSPAPDYFGTETFTYDISDGNGGTDSATVTVTVSNQNDDPTANDDTFMAAEDSSGNSLDVLTNDSILPDTGETLTITNVGTPDQGGSAVNSGGSAIDYSPATDFFGTETFTYTISDGNGGSDTASVTVTVNATDDGVTANDDPTGFTTDEDTILNSGNVLSNDLAPDGGLMAVAAGTTSAQGADVTINANGTFSYDPTGSANLQALAAGANINDTFTYTARDTDSDTDTATVTVMVSGVNDLVSATDDSGFSTDEDTALTNEGNLFSNDSAPDGGMAFQTASLTSSQGAMVTLNADGSFDYDPTGSSTLQALVGGTVNDTFTYTLQDTDGDSDTATITVVVSGVNDPPLVGEDSYKTVGNTKLAVGGASPGSLAYVTGTPDVLDNDQDGEENSSISISSLQGTSGMPPLTGNTDLGGSVTLNADGSFTYTPPAGVKNKVDNTGGGGSDDRDKFTYGVSDGTDETTGNVYIEIVDGLVWYVHNNPGGEPLNAAGGDGTSADPFDKLSDGAGDSSSDDPEDASSDNDIVLVFEGDGTSSNQNLGIALKNGQKLLGHVDATLTVDSVTIQIPNPAGSTMSPATDRPMIGNSGGNGVTVTAATGARTGIEIRGLDISGSDNAIDVTSSGTNAVEATIKNNYIRSSGNEGVDLNPDGSGDFDVVFDGNEYSTSSPSGHGFDLTTAATTQNAVNLAVKNNTSLVSTGSNKDALHIDASTIGGMGKVFITNFSNNSISDLTGNFGIFISNATFDADPSTTNFDPISLSGVTLGSMANPIGHGISLQNISGDLTLTDVSIETDGNGLLVTGSGSFVDGSPDMGLKFTMNGMNTVTASGANPVSFSDMTADASISDVQATGGGVSLVRVDGGFDITGSGSTVRSFDVDAGKGSVTYSGTINNSTARSVSVVNRPAGSGNITFGGDIGTSGSPNGGTGILVDNNSSAAVAFQGGVYLSTGGNNAVTLTDNSGASVNFSGGLEITTSTGNGFTATGGGTVSVDGSMASKTITTNGGNALTLDSVNVGSVGVAFNTVTAANCSTQCVSVNQLGSMSADPALAITLLDVDQPGQEGVLIKKTAANVAITGGDITDAAGSSAGFRIGDGTANSGGAGNISYGGSINANSASGRSVHIDHRTGGTVMFSGNISDNGMGILLDTNTGSSLDFTGQLTLKTSANKAFTATGGGTVNVTATGNTIGTSGTPITGVGVDIQNTTIGTGGVAFQSIHVSTAGSGIILNSTGTGPFTVTGDGTASRNGSGGVLSGTSGDSIDLTDAANVAIKSMNILNSGGHAIDSSGGRNIVFSGVTVQNPTGSGWNGVNLGGTSGIDSNSLFTQVDTSNEQALHVQNMNTNLTEFFIDSSTFSNQDSSNGSTYVIFDCNGTSAMTVNIRGNSLFTDLFGHAVQGNAGNTSGSSGTLNFNIKNSSFTNAFPGTIGSGASGGIGGVVLSAAEAATLNFDIDNNVFNDLGRPLFNGGLINIQGIGGNSKIIDGYIRNNDIDRIGFTQSTGADTSGGYRVIDVVTENAINYLDVIIDNNDIDETGREAIFISSRDSSPDFDIRVNNNRLGVVSRIGRSNREAIEILSENSSNMEIEVTNNTIKGNTDNLDQVVDIDVENTSTMHMTFTGNTVTNDAAGRETVIDTESGTSTLCLSFTGNTSQEVEFDENGTFNVEDYGNIGTNNPGVGSFITDGTISNVSAGTCNHPDF